MSLRIVPVYLSLQFGQRQSVQLYDFSSEVISSDCSIWIGFLETIEVPAQGVSDQQIVLGMVGSDHTDVGRTFPYKGTLSLSVWLEVTGVEISGEVLFSQVGDLVISFIDSAYKTVVDQCRQTPVDTGSMAVYIPRNRSRTQLQPSIEDFQNPLVSRILHPGTGFSHYIPISYHLLTWFETTYSLHCIEQRVALYCRRFYYDGLESDQVARVSRGSDCPLDPFGKCGLVVGHQIRGGSRIRGTQAMYDDDTRGLEGPERPAESTTTNQRLLADGGTTWGNLTGFQRDCLEAIARLERSDEDLYGLAIKRQLEDQHGEVNHGRLYPNLDDLVELGLVEKSELDKRTNEYALSRDGRGLLIQRVERMAAACDMTTAVADGSDGGERA